MFPLDPALVVAAVVVFLIAGLVKGVIGLGMPTVVMGLLTIVMPPAAAANLLLLPTVLTNLWQLLPASTFWPLLRRLAGLLIGLFVGAMFNGLPALGEGYGWAQHALGAILAVYGAWGLAGRRLPAPGRHEVWLSPLVGYTTGAITAATGIFVFPLVPYVQSLQMDKDRLVQAMGIIFCAATLALTLRLGASGVLHTANVLASLVYLLPAALGMWAGQIVRRRVSEAAFKRAFFVGVLLLGVYMFFS
ncbi:sulfite exporter TauE/SafE family protein [Verticiella sediminum]|uniref:Probable membrane transporter protein n=1 Tax=Verticiella sediminum TaxID=1247510 RepID=A0A556A7Z4_9BURK|nr:sulfite exporter TauE/SafE family protein [Verticiella sediminum]TSH89014.1 sulfite exporter TauE/SafE family protein [Verticiella sediminum]